MTRRKFFAFLTAATIFCNEAAAQRRPPKLPIRKPCPTCYGTGQIVISGGQSRKCPRCNGKGFID